MLETINNLYYQIQKYNNDDLINEYLMLLAIYNINILNYLFFEIHNFVFDEKKYRNDLIRIHQNKFRNELINLYKGCIITGVSNFQACHIIPFCNSDYNNKYDKYNGILLKADLHELFDKYIFSINPESFKIEFDDEYFKDPKNKEEYGRFNGFELTIEKNDKLKYNLLEHYNNFIQKN